MNHEDALQLFMDNIRSKYSVSCGCIKVSQINFYPELRQPCESNVCGNYGKNYMCPPLVGTPDEVIQKAKKFDKAVIFQKIYPLEDSYDYEGMVAGQKAFKNTFFAIAHDAEKVFDAPLLLGAGACQICERCAAIDAMPCRFPVKARPSLEAYCIQVSEISKACGMNYINGQNTVTYFGGVLINSDQ